MDTSEEYIKMCDCPEIQEQWNPDVCDFAVKREADHKLIPITKIRNKFYYIFLPRQDQIQKIWSPTVEPWFGVILAFISWFETINPDKYQSVEQLWLAFYMHEKHGKVWNSEKWMKNEEKASSAISR